MLNAVPDTNILVASILWSGNPRRIRLEAEAGRVALATSLPLLAEVTHVLRDYFGFTDEEAYYWYQHLGELCQVVTPTERLNAVPDDPDDNMVIECAVAAMAQYIITRDNDLLRLNRYRDVEIVDDGRFLEIFAASQRDDVN